MYPRTLTIDDIEALALGAWILGTGGGGSPYHRLLNMRELYRAGHEVTLIDPMSLTDDALERAAHGAGLGDEVGDGGGGGGELKITPAIQAPRVMGLVSRGPEVMVITAPLVITPPCRRSSTNCLAKGIETGPPSFPLGSSPYHLRSRGDRKV